MKNYKKIKNIYFLSFENKKDKNKKDVKRALRFLLSALGLMVAFFAGWLLLVLSWYAFAPAEML